MDNEILEDLLVDLITNAPGKATVKEWDLFRNYARERIQRYNIDKEK